MNDSSQLEEALMSNPINRSGRRRGRGGKPPVIAATQSEEMNSPAPKETILSAPLEIEEVGVRVPIGSTERIDSPPPAEPAAVVDEAPPLPPPPPLPPSPAASGLVPPPTPDGLEVADSPAARRHAAAQNLVERYIAWSVAGVGIPLPLVDTVTLLLVQREMIRHLTELYGVAWSQERIRMTLGCVAGAAAPTGLAAWVVNAIGRSVPGVNLVGLAVSAAAAAAATRTLGLAVILHLESGGTALDFNPPALRRHYAQRYAGGAQRYADGTSSP